MSQRNRECDKKNGQAECKNNSNVAATIFGTLLAGAALGLAAFVGYQVLSSFT
jgi:hypothetical protein